MNPGIYTDISFDDYLEIDAVSNTRLGQLEFSERHYFSPKQIDKRASEYGTVQHAYHLTPAEFRANYVVMPAYELDEANVNSQGTRSTSHSTAYVRDSREAFREANAGKTICSKQDYEAALATAESIASNPDVSRWLHCPGDPEVTVVWTDQTTGLKCKGRIDWLTNEFFRTPVDLKTTPSVRSFHYKIQKYRYYRQAAMYLDGLAANGITGDTFVFVPMEKDSPYSCAAAPLAPKWVDLGRREYKKLLCDLHALLQRGGTPRGIESPKLWCDDLALESRILDLGQEQQELENDDGELTPPF